MLFARPASRSSRSASVNAACKTCLQVFLVFLSFSVNAACKTCLQVFLVFLSASVNAACKTCLQVFQVCQCKCCLQDLPPGLPICQCKCCLQDLPPGLPDLPICSVNAACKTCLLVFQVFLSASVNAACKTCLQIFQVFHLLV